METGLAARSSFRTAAALLLIVSGMAVGAAAQEIDIVAESAYLRTAPNGGDAVTDPALGQAVYLHVAYHVDGTTMPITANVRGLLDGEEQCGGAVDLMPEGEFVVYCTDSWTATPGTHVLRWELDSDFAIDETNEDNNVAEVVFTVGDPSADLVAERAYLRTAPNGGDEVAIANAGEEVFLHVDYRLDGVGFDVPAGGRALVDGEVQCAGTIDFTAENPGPIYCTSSWTATAGTHLLRWELDPDNTLLETDESNNTAEHVFGVGGPPGDANCDAAAGAADVTAFVEHLAAATRAECRLDDANASQQLDPGDVVATAASIFGTV